MMISPEYRLDWLQLGRSMFIPTIVTTSLHRTKVIVMVITVCLPVPIPKAKAANLEYLTILMGTHDRNWLRLDI